MAYCNFRHRDCPEGTKRVYVLELNEGKYYVGASYNFSKRIGFHDAEWVEKYGYKSLVERSDACVNAWRLLEKNMTLKYMRKHGWQNVRGGPWCQVDMDEPPVPLRDGS